MKHPRLKIKKRSKVGGIRKLENDIDEIIHNCLMDIKWYIKKDIISYLRKKEIIYAETSTKNKKAKRK